MERRVVGKLGEPPREFDLPGRDALPDAAVGVEVIDTGHAHEQSPAVDLGTIDLAQWLAFRRECLGRDAAIDADARHVFVFVHALDAKAVHGPGLRATDSAANDSRLWR